jgi:holo-[acyl-carrier protein] synthase
MVSPNMNSKIGGWIKASWQRLTGLGQGKSTMRIAVGNDIVWIPEVEKSVLVHGQRYLQRIYTKHELDSCRNRDTSVRCDSLAARFAAKEAVMKVLRPTPDQAVSWASIEIIRDSSGAPAVALQGSAQVAAQAAGIEQWSVSLSHDHEYASATVIAMCKS